jgi:hypothetical protein
VKWPCKIDSFPDLNHKAFCRPQVCQFREFQVDIYIPHCFPTKGDETLFLHKLDRALEWRECGVETITGTVNSESREFIVYIGNNYMMKKITEQDYTMTF